MKLVALLAWYDEDPRMLADMVESLVLVDVDHLVALDGAYGLLPGGRPVSPPAQWLAIKEAAARVGIDVTIEAPRRRWLGNEVEKRTHLFELGERICDRSDWYLVIDADTVVAEVPLDLKAALARTDRDAAYITLEEHAGDAEIHARDTRQPFRALFRAGLGLAVVGNHFTYVTADGRRLWGNETAGEAIEPALDLTAVTLAHRTAQRDTERHARQYAYYRRRDQLGVELGSCARCTKRAARRVAIGWERHPDGLAAGWVEVCHDHAAEVQAEGEREIRELGFDPNGIRPVVR